MRLKYIAVITGFIIIMASSCTRTEPVISYGFLQLVLYQGETQPQEHFSFFILAEDEDGFDNLEEVYLYHDREQLRWHFKSDDWMHYRIDGKDWIGTRSITMQDGNLPRGTYRAVLFNKSGESTRRNFTYDGNVSYPFPELSIAGGTYVINSRWPSNRLVCYDNSGNYISTVTVDSLSGSVLQLRLPSSARTAALWAEDEYNFCNAFTNVVPVN
ncbi:MAG: hypothetical protein FWC06_04290 [Treponema sp.]|nr:hypothetical protein [Treponema sp.]